MSLDARIASLIAFSQSRADAPAPPKDRITGSDKNEEGSAKNKSGDISLDESTISALKKKVEEHNAAMRERKRPEWTHVRLPSLKAVYRRGAGAFSTSHRPGMTRDRWAMARVNAFLTLSRRGRPENSKYVGDNDLLHSDHPRHSNQSRAMGTGTNAGGGATTGADDCGRDEGGKFGIGNKCAGNGGGKSSAANVSNPQNDKSWIDYSGTFHPTGGGFGLYREEHQEWAESHDETVSGLFRKGWGRVNKVDDTVWVANADGKVPSGKQLSSLIDYAIFSNASQVVFDPGAGVKKKVLWDRSEDRAFCPTGPGGGIDNSCGKSSGEPPRERLSSARTRGGRQTDIARKINQMGSSEKQIEQLVRDLGGDLKKTLIDMETTRGNEGLNIFVRDKELDENYYIHFGYYGATIYPTEKLSDEKTKEVVAAAEKAFPKTISDRLWLRGKPFPIAISYNYKNEKPGFTSGKATARYASLLAFAEARDCGRDPDGKFSTGNTCAGGAVAEAAKGAVTGGIKGAVTGLLTGGPVIVKPAAAIGAATGAVKGLYDNQMRPTRVKRAIERIGMTEKGVGSLVEKLGGTPESSADVRGNSLRLTIRDKEGNKTFHVEVNNKTITVYPRRASGELNSKEIERLKTIADEATPKSVGVVVKQSSSAYIAKLVKSGFSIAAGHARDILLATYSTPIVHSVAVDTLQSLKKRRF